MVDRSKPVKDDPVGAGGSGARERKSARFDPGTTILKSTGWWVAFGGSLVVATLAISPPVLGEAARDVVMAMFSGVCHQMPARSPHVDGIQLAVCHRCAGIYWGLPAAALLFGAIGDRLPVARSGAPLLLAAAAAPAVIDWALDVFGLWVNTPVTRMATGLVFGLGAGWFLVRATTRAGTGPDGSGSAARDPNPSPEESGKRA